MNLAGTGSVSTHLQKSKVIGFKFQWSCCLHSSVLPSATVTLCLEYNCGGGVHAPPPTPGPPAARGPKTKVIGFKFQTSPALHRSLLASATLTPCLQYNCGLGSQPLPHPGPAPGPPPRRLSENQSDWIQVPMVWCPPWQ